MPVLPQAQHVGGTGYGDPKQSRCPQDRRYCQQPGVGLAFQCQVDDEQASYQHQTCGKQESDDGAGRLLPWGLHFRRRALKHRDNHRHTCPVADERECGGPPAATTISRTVPITNRTSIPPNNSNNCLSGSEPVRRLDAMKRTSTDMARKYAQRPKGADLCLGGSGRYLPARQDEQRPDVQQGTNAQSTVDRDVQGLRAVNARRPREARQADQYQWQPQGPARRNEVRIGLQIVGQQRDPHEVRGEPEQGTCSQEDEPPPASDLASDPMDAGPAEGDGGEEPETPTNHGRIVSNSGRDCSIMPAATAQRPASASTTVLSVR